VERHVEFVQRAVGFIDRAEDRGVVIKPKRLESSPAPEHEVQHGPNLLLERSSLPPS
jgi:hypothetical protein